MTSRAHSHGTSYSQTKAFAYISKVSDEKKVQTKEILNEIKGMKKRDLYLDFGAGVGDVSFKVSKKFKKTILIEPGERMVPFLKEKKKKHNSDVLIYKMKGEDFFKKYGKKYLGKIDLITFVHSDYYVKNIKKEINKMKKYLSKKGKIIIITSHKQDLEMNFVNSFRVKFCGSEPYDPKKHISLERLFPEAKVKLLDVKYKITNIDYLLKNPKKANQSPTNYFLKFAIKRWVDELNQEELKHLKNYLKKCPFVENKHIIRGRNIMLVLDKGDLK